MLNFGVLVWDKRTFKRRNLQRSHAALGLPRYTMLSVGD